MENENGVGLVALAWQMAKAWIPAYAGMTVGVVLVVKGGFEPRPSTGGLPEVIFRVKTEVRNPGRPLALHSRSQRVEYGQIKGCT